MFYKILKKYTSSTAYMWEDVEYHMGHNDGRINNTVYTFYDRRLLPYYVDTAFGDPTCALYIADVDTAVGVKITQDNNGIWSALSVYVENIQPLADFKAWEHYDFCRNAVHINYKCLSYVKNQDYEMCSAAVAKNGLAIQHVKNQTHDLCMIAASHDGNSIEHIREQTPEVCEAAVKQNGYSLQHVKQQTAKICEAAIRQNPFALCQVQQVTEQLCLDAVDRCHDVFPIIKHPTERVCLRAAEQNGLFLKSILNPSKAVIVAAVKQNGMALEFVPPLVQDTEICEIAVMQNPMAVKFTSVVTPTIVEIVKKTDIRAACRSLSKKKTE